ncbi:NapC/NirT family cytochrome c [Lonepinella koalarum]|uniref:NapC/NirT family cytochrome c n=1 Tax=Lonepinella koalarum TaxID=53417 RepID=UPI003F6E2914
MSQGQKKKKVAWLTAIGLMIVGAVALFGVQSIMKATSSTEFCVSCHSMEHPKAEWEGSVHFMNSKGIRAECSDCHVPHDGLDYVKAKFIALKDVWYTITNKLPDKEAYETHRLELAQKVWDDLKSNDSATCRSCHSFDAMEFSEQKKDAQKMHLQAQQNNQTCIDCHKGVAHFMPEMPVDNGAALGELTKHAGQFNVADKTLYALTLTNATLVSGEEIRLMPYAELNDWQEQGEQLIATVKGWQQAGAESLIYMELGKRINVAVLSDEAKEKVQVVKSVHDEVTDSEWKEVSLVVNVAKSAVTSDSNSLNAFGNNLNQTHCSTCHAAIGAEHYTANQWIGVVNSMKDRTSMTENDVRAVTIYLQRNAKDKSEK